jgi:hypothetical protein
MKELDHPNLIKLHEIIEEIDGDKIYLSIINLIYIYSYNICKTWLIINF